MKFRDAVRSMEASEWIAWAQVLVAGSYFLYCVFDAVRRAVS
jgi:hypothetical protein